MSRDKFFHKRTGCWDSIGPHGEEWLKVFEYKACEGVVGAFYMDGERWRAVSPSLELPIKLKLPNDIAQSLGVSAYVFQKDFDFSQALLFAVNLEGHMDKADSAESDNAEYPLPPSSPLSSPLSSPPPTRPPSLPLSPNELVSKKRQHGKAHSKQNRKKHRQEAPPKAAADILTRSDPANRFVSNGAAFSVAYSMADDAPVASTSYVGLLDIGPKRLPLLRTTVPFADANSRIFGLVAYGDSSIKQCAEDVVQLLKKTRAQASFTGKQKYGRCGNFTNLNTGVAHGGGRLASSRSFAFFNADSPKPSQRPANAAVIDELINSVPFKRLSGLYNYCNSQFERLLVNDNSLIRIFDNSVLASVAFNFGPCTVCIPHVDFGNLPFLWCWIWGLGWFNWKKGSHLVLWDLKVVVEFPPWYHHRNSFGRLRHGNTPLYSSGGNFRWVNHGFQTEEDFKAKRSAEKAKEEEIWKCDHWEMGLNMFSTLEELGLHT
ncbi:hypothetical protein BT96DRAFT_939311 [Gymnopus androsaceus JB14]|uniref:Uncharacterized protein n=1 Tax=Gymnopus androsaceus JB14 TaxID=1447944 RepID=A0A6A4HPH3_9AGAR|nr:hypothetical protein BT96DRAFT_939311 [Gymnopus androsaceus JB14]